MTSLNRHSLTYRLLALSLVILLMPGWYALGTPFCPMDAQGDHAECCDSGSEAPSSSDYDLPQVTELNKNRSETAQNNDSESSCHESAEKASHDSHQSSEGDCNCCDKCEITSGTSQPSNVLDQALTLDTYSAETHLYEKETLLSPDHHQVAELHNEPAQFLPPLYLMNQVFLN